LVPGYSDDRTLLLENAAHGEASACQEFEGVLVQELRQIAGRLMSNECAGHTLQPTALVNEAYFKLIDQKRANIASRTHFLKIASRIMQRLLIDHARKRNADKRGGGKRPVPLRTTLVAADADEYDAMNIHDAMSRLGEEFPRQKLVMEYEYYSGATQAEIASLLGVSDRTVRNDRVLALAWLRRYLSSSE